MEVLVIHDDFPGPLTGWLEGFRGDPTVSVTIVPQPDRRKEASPFGTPVPRPAVGAPSRSSHHYIYPYEELVRRGLAYAHVSRQLAESGYRPDVVIGFIGDGGLTYIRDVFPDTAVIGIALFLNLVWVRDWSFANQLALTSDQKMAGRILGGVALTDLEQCDAVLTPGRWERDSLPLAFRDRAVFAPFGHAVSAVAEAVARLGRADALSRLGIAIPDDARIITLVAPHLEPGRGVTVLLRAFARLSRAVPELHLLLVGGDDVSMGRWPAMGTHRQLWTEQMAGKIDQSRVHFVGSATMANRLAAYRLSDVHVHFTYPLAKPDTLSEAMSAGVAIVGSRTGPVMDRIRHGETGLLVDFFDHEGLADAVTDLLRNPDEARTLGMRAHDLIMAEEDRDAVAVPRFRRIVEALVGTGALPPELGAGTRAETAA